MWKLFIILSLVFIALPSNSFSQDKIEKVLGEIRKDIAVIKEGQSSINQRIDDLDRNLNQRIDDLDRNLNQRIDDLDKNLNQRIDDLDKKINQRIDDLKDIMVTGFGILVSGMCILIGFILWDRRTALAPAVKKIEELEQREKAVEETLKLYAKKNKEFKEAMQTVGLIPLGR